MRRQKHTERSQWQLKPWATRQCCDYSSAGEEAKCCDCYSWRFASLGTDSVIIYIFGAFCKVANPMVETWIAALQVFCNYFICLPVWVLMSTKSPWTTFATSTISLCPSLSKMSGIIRMFSQMVLLWLARNRDRITGVCKNTNEKSI